MNESVLQLVTPDAILGKGAIAKQANAHAEWLLESNDAVHAYVMAKQYEQAAEVLVKMLKPKAELAWSGAESMKIGAAKVEFVNARPKDVYEFDESTQTQLNDCEEMIAVQAARIDTIKKQAIEQGRAKLVDQVATGRGGIKITFDK
jgi:hypothetical protein